MTWCLCVLVRKPVITNVSESHLLERVVQQYHQIRMQQVFVTSKFIQFYLQIICKTWVVNLEKEQKHLTWQLNTSSQSQHFTTFKFLYNPSLQEKPKHWTSALVIKKTIWLLLTLGKNKGIHWKIMKSQLGAIINSDVLSKSWGSRLHANNKLTVLQCKEYASIMRA